MTFRRHFGFALLAGTLAFTLPPAASAQEEKPAPEAPAPAEPEESFFESPAGSALVDRLRLSGWVNLNMRHSDDHRVRSNFPGFPSPQFMRTPDPGSSYEISDVTLQLDATFSENVEGRVKIDFIDLYDRNPTSSDQKIDVDEAWIRFGSKYEARQLPPGTSFFVLAGKAPKFEKQVVRHSESYGLVSTAFNRMEDLQLQLGGSFGRHVYYRAQVSTGNPVFLRDPGALAGDNGISLSAGGPLGTGFPILYDAEVEDLQTDSDALELGGGLGLRFASDDGSNGIDLLAFWYDRDMADRVEMNGSEYGGDLDLLSVDVYSLPVDGRQKTEFGGNLDLRVGGFTAFVQYVDQEIAGLERTGLEVEMAFRWNVPPVLALGGSQFLTFIQPAIRWSQLDNDFRGPAQFPAPSFWWDWEKIDFAVRVGLMPGIDFTVEHALHDVEAKVPFEYGETLATLHVGF